eukprot:SAG31_NODE_523_length_14545_cov_4.805067_1_plen_213_part_00
MLDHRISIWLLATTIRAGCLVEALAATHGGQGPRHRDGPGTQPTTRRGMRGRRERAGRAGCGGKMALATTAVGTVLALVSAAVGPDDAPAARRVCCGMPIHAALEEVRIPAEAAAKAGQLMSAHGLATVLDLRPLRRAPAEAEELMALLSVDGLAVGHRAKLRLLLDQAGGSLTEAAYTWGRQGSVDRQRAQPHRQMQGNGGSDGVSSDTVS